jgi:hypothetical protein
VEKLVLDGEDPTLRIDPGADMMALLARVVGGHQVLAPVFDPFDWAPEAQRGERYQHVFGVELPPDAKLAADMALVEMDRSGAAPEHAGQQVAGPMRYLGGAIKLQDVRYGIMACKCTARRDRHPRVTSHHKLQLDDCMCGPEARFDVSIALASDIWFRIATRCKLLRRVLDFEDDR